MASASGTPGNMAISRAAPGVDHAVMTGIFIFQLKKIPVTPLPMETAHIHEEVTASGSPARWAA